MKIEIPKKKLEHLIQMRNILVGTLIFLIVIIFFVILGIFNSDKASLGLRVAEAKIGNLNFAQLEEKLKILNEDFLNKNISLNHQNQSWQTTPSKLGIEIDISKTALIAFNYGRNGKNIIINSWQQLKSLLGRNSPIIWKLNEEKMENFLRENLGSIHRPAENAALIFNKQKQDFLTIPEKNGIAVDKEKIKIDIEKNVLTNKKDVVWLDLNEDIAEVKEVETQSAREEINKIISSLPISINILDPFGGSEKEVDKIEKEELLNLIVFEPINDPLNSSNKILGLNINREKAKEYLTSLAPIINREPIDARLTIKNGKVSVFALSQEGVRLEIEESIDNFSEGILKNKAISLKTTLKRAAITTENIDNLGITALLGKGVSNFVGSPVNRSHNIKIATAKFNGTLIKPGEEFSFNQILGEVGPEQGYEPELVIKKNKTVPEYGGGVCQVSTTVFRAAVNSGLKVTERFAHAFPVKYYNPQGFDATIYPPSPDLKFINDTPANILLQGKIVGTELIFEIYGTEDFRQVKIDGPKQYDTKEDGSMKAALTQEVYDKDGNLMFKKIFNSNYKSPDLYPVERNPLE